MDVCTLAALASLQRHKALRRYAGAALNIGLDARAIQEVLIQIGIYAGFTASEEALDTAAEVFKTGDRLFKHPFCISPNVSPPRGGVN